MASLVQPLSDQLHLVSTSSRPHLLLNGDSHYLRSPNSKELLPVVASLQCLRVFCFELSVVKNYMLS
jgi:hypothetical protein